MPARRYGDDTPVSSVIADVIQDGMTVDDLAVVLGSRRVAAQLVGLLALEGILGFERSSIPPRWIAPRAGLEVELLRRRGPP